MFYSNHSCQKHRFRVKCVGHTHGRIDGLTDEQQFRLMPALRRRDIKMQSGSWRKLRKDDCGGAHINSENARAAGVRDRSHQSGFDIVTTSSLNVGRCLGLQHANRISQVNLLRQVTAFSAAVAWHYGICIKPSWSEKRHGITQS